jgi:hypothetical protein
MVMLVALGKEGHTIPGYVPTPFEGTSVAVPRVSRIATLLCGLLNAVHVLAGLIRDEVPREFTVDDYLRACVRFADLPEIDAPETILHGLPGDAVETLLRFLGSAALHGSVIAPSLTGGAEDSLEPVGTVRRMLQAMARPMDGYESHQVGAGFVNDEIAEAWLADLRTVDFARLRYGGILDLANHPPDDRLLTPPVLERIRGFRDTMAGTMAKVI